MGTFGDEPNTGQVDTYGETAAGLVGAASANATNQAEAGRFIRENGAAVIDGHAPVAMSTAANIGVDPDGGGMDASD